LQHFFDVSEIAFFFCEHSFLQAVPCPDICLNKVFSQDSRSVFEKFPCFALFLNFCDFIRILIQVFVNFLTYRLEYIVCDLS
jgi:hypothetical protein